MYIHIGENILIQTTEIIAIIDKKSFKSNEEANSILLNQYPVEDLANCRYKSIIITNNKIFLSPFTTNILKKRINQFPVHVGG